MQDSTANERVKVIKIPRSREVGQSYITSVATTLIALAAAFRIVLREDPDLVCSRVCRVIPSLPPVIPPAILSLPTSHVWKHSRAFVSTNDFHACMYLLRVPAGLRRILQGLEVGLLLRKGGREGKHKVGVQGVKIFFWGGPGAGERAWNVHPHLLSSFALQATPRFVLAKLPRMMSLAVCLDEPTGTLAQWSTPCLT